MNNCSSSEFEIRILQKLNTLIDLLSNAQTIRAGSLVRTGRRPPKPVVVGSNPTPPVYDATPPDFRRGYVRGSFAFAKYLVTVIVADVFESGF